MSSGMETVEIVDRWLFETLSGDAALMELIGGDDQLISTLAKAGVKPPYVVWFMSSERDLSVVGGIRSQVDTIYTVKAVGEGATWEKVKPIAHRIDQLLDMQDVTLPYGTVSCRRQTIVQYPEVDQATQFRHLGATYRIYANSL